MNVLRVGPLLVDLKLLFVIAAAIAGYLALIGRKEMRDKEDAAISVLVNAFLIGLLIWKLSPVLFDLKSVIQQPLSLLYFHGGQRGVWLGIAAAVFYVAWRMNKLQVPLPRYGELVLIGWTTGMGIYHLLSAVAFDRETIVHTFAALLNFVVSGYFLSRRIEQTSQASLLRISGWYFLAMLALPFLQEYRESIVWGFSLEQLIWGTLFLSAFGAPYLQDRATGKEN